jgi:hypothetical protein
MTDRQPTEAESTPDDMDGHEQSEGCWCGPTIEEHENGKLIIHQRTDN